MGGGVSLLAATWDGRGIGGSDESTTLGLLCPSTGAGGPFALRTYQPVAEVAMHENNAAVRHGLRVTKLPEAIEEVYAWEQQTAQCPLHIPGPPTALCVTCGLAKWKHYVLAAVVADGAGLVNHWFEPQEKNCSWLTTQSHPCKGCKATVAQYVDMWWAHNRYPRRPAIGAFPNDLFPTLPLFRKILCQMHTGEKIGSWAVSCVLDLLEDTGLKPAAAQLTHWVQRVDPTWSRWEVRTKGKKETRGDKLIAMVVTKRLSIACANEGRCWPVSLSWTAMWSVALMTTLPSDVCSPQLLTASSTLPQSASHTCSGRSSCSPGHFC